MVNRAFRILLFLLLLVTVIFIGGVALGMSEGRVSTKPAYQDPPLYPHAQDVIVEKPPNGVERFTRFSTANTPIQVLAFYADALPRGGWEFDEAYDDGVRYRYVGTDGPAFGLEIRFTESADSRTQVMLRQVISGPFVWHDR